MSRVRRAIQWVDWLLFLCLTTMVSMGAYVYLTNGQVLSREMESRLFPVVVDWRVEKWDRDPETNRVSFDLYANKVRPCTYIDTSLIFGGEGIVPAETGFVDLVDTTPGSSRPTGLQYIGRYELHTKAFPPGGFVSGAVTHQCHGGAPTVTLFGPFVAPEDL